MALPTTGLTLNLDASVLADIWTTYVSGGPNTGVPSDGSTIQAWEDATGANRLGKQEGANGLPTAQITTPLMALQCLDFSGSQFLRYTNDTGTAQALSTIIAANAFTIFLSIYPNGGGAYQNYQGTGIIGDTGGYWSVMMGNDGGTYKATAYNYDGTQDYVSVAAPLNTSHVVMARHESGTLYLSVDDGAESSVSSGNTSSLGGGVRIGHGSNNAYDGRIGEIAVYNVALTGTDKSDAMAYFVSKWLTPPGSGARAFASFIG